MLMFTHTALANVEKAIFLGPPPVSSQLSSEALADLHIDTLTPDNWSLRTRLKAGFPSASHPHGKATWLLLDQLAPGQRYEVRVCWPANVSPCPASLRNINTQPKVNISNTV